MRLSSLTYIITELNALIDTGRHNISLAEVKKHIQAGDILQFIVVNTERDIDLSALSPEQETEIVAGLQDILTTFDGTERLKWGIENNGLCLVLAWVNELIQLRHWKD